MGVRKLGACHRCVYWRGPGNQVLAEMPAKVGKEASQATGMCHRRVQTGEDGQRPRQPETPYLSGCSESVSLPAPERLPDNCEGCRFWREIPKIGGAREGLCLVWAPRWSRTAGGRADGKAAFPDASLSAPGHYAWPITTPDFFCGDGVSRDYADPEELDEGEEA